MKRKLSKIIMPITIIAGIVTAIVGAMTFAKNKAFRKFVKKTSYNLIQEIKMGLTKIKTKIEEVENGKDNPIINTLGNAIDDITHRLNNVSKEKINSTLDGVAKKINEVLEKVEEQKQKKVDPAIKNVVKSVEESLKDLRSNINKKIAQ